MFRLLLLGIIVWIQTLYAIPLLPQKSELPLLPHTEIFVDHHHVATIKNIAQYPFQLIYVEKQGFGYGPDFSVWVRWRLTNDTDKPLQRILEYANPLTPHLTLYDGETHAVIGKIDTYSQRVSPPTINPIFQITLLPHETKSYYLQADSPFTTLIIKLLLWKPEAFYHKEIRHHFILALFFGAMGIVILYNFIVYLSTREKSYLYYVLFFVSITLHQLLYRGIMPVYLLPPSYIRYFAEYATFVVAAPVFFLALFTKTLLKLQQYPRLNQLLTVEMLLYPLLVLWMYFSNHSQYRGIPSVLILFSLLLITLFALYKGNRNAKFIIIGWLLFFSMSFFMLLSSLGIYDIYQQYPYYTEGSLVLETLIFTLLLGDYIKQLDREKLEMKDTLIAYQKDEREKLTRLVEVQTADLQQSLADKDTLLEELNHRVKNSMQTIITFLRLQIDESQTEEIQTLLQNVENRVFAINQLYALLHTRENLSMIDAAQYFSLMITHIQKGFAQDNIYIKLHTTLTLHSDEAIYCGFILNEAITNTYKHAFNPIQEGEITITLTQEGNHYRLEIRDNGCGYIQTAIRETLGLTIIETLATKQLSGNLEINSTEGTTITITWRHYA